MLNILLSILFYLGVWKIVRFQLQWRDSSRREAALRTTSGATLEKSLITLLQNRAQSVACSHQPLSQQNQIFRDLADALPQSHPLIEILKTTVTQLGDFLNCDRVLIYQFNSSYIGAPLVECSKPGCSPIQPIMDIHSCLDCLGLSSQNIRHAVLAVEDRLSASLPPSLQQLLSQHDVRANLMVPLQSHTHQPWGLLVAQQCTVPRQWQTHEIDGLQELATQLSLMIQNIELHDKVQSLRQQLEAQIQKTTECLQQEQQAQQKVLELKRTVHLQNDFLRTVCNELRSPLSNIGLAGKLLEQSLERCGIWAKGDPSVGRYLQTLQTECERETDLMNDLLDLARLESGLYFQRLSCLDVAPWICRFVQPFVNLMAQRQQYLILDVAAQMPALTTDLNCLEKVLHELMHNACQFTPVGEAIEIEAQATPKHLMLQIKHFGKQFSEDNLPHVFDQDDCGHNQMPGNRSDHKLRFALVQKYIEHIQGEIRVSHEAEWTCFTLQLPWTLLVSENQPAKPILPIAPL
jgi:signal transduction histidine kinase